MYSLNLYRRKSAPLRDPFTCVTIATLVLSMTSGKWMVLSLLYKPQRLVNEFLSPWLLSGREMNRV